MNKHYEFGPDMHVDMEIRDDVIAIQIDDDMQGSFGFVITPHWHSVGAPSLDVVETNDYVAYAVELLDEQ
jgi:hypothetical protein